MVHGYLTPLHYPLVTFLDQTTEQTGEVRSFTCRYGAELIVLGQSVCYLSLTAACVPED